MPFFLSLFLLQLNADVLFVSPEPSHSTSVPGPCTLYPPITRLTPPHPHLSQRGADLWLAYLKWLDSYFSPSNEISTDHGFRDSTHFRRHARHGIPDLFTVSRLNQLSQLAFRD